jgi:integrase
MAFLVDTQELKPGLVIFRRADVKHKNWYRRVKLPQEDRYKTVSLKTADIDAARERAFDQDADLRFRIKHEVPIFNRPFSQIAQDYINLQKERVEAGQITLKPLQLVESTVRANLNRYVGPVQISHIGQDRWLGYPLWRQKTWRERFEAEKEEQTKAQGGPQTSRRVLPARVSDATIRTEMSIFRAIMAYAASKRFISDSQMFKGKLPLDKVRRENGSVPCFNSNRPKPVYDYTYEPALKFRHAVLRGRGSRFPWSLRPNGNDEMRARFMKHFTAEPRKT